MKSTDFPESNYVNQVGETATYQYKANVYDDNSNSFEYVVECKQLSWSERCRLFITGKLWTVICGTTAAITTEKKDLFNIK